MAGSPARAAGLRRRRAQGGQRRQRPRRRRSTPGRRRPDRGGDHASWRPRLPRGWRRVRGHPSELRCRDRARGRAADARRGARRRRPERADRAVLALDRRQRLSRTRAPRPTSSTGMPTRPCTGASVTAGPPSSRSTPATTAIPRPSGRPPSWPRTSRRCSRSRALRPVYQPIFSMETGLPVGFEGLVRPDGRRAVP